VHRLRHTFGTRMINSGVPQHVIQRLLGHASPGMTSVYAIPRELHQTGVTAVALRGLAA
jgi:integrase